ncbi:predicted protein [Naegleria gruberi]|uniref:Predicted protein n=1 Tax=Naegleria gruberi TaxID=5762 RepID=D2VAX7_NAEGR|nr:uncharacterized protein NAEGRDRAFT_66014 [Naegleria gruberi]EFC46158.1 predicted protein [Naegleria gruberi]|eukprot:XP_002678902.1 predicted protein [Naegleria gruberi strain NEG-M]
MMDTTITSNNNNNIVDDHHNTSSTKCSKTTFYRIFATLFSVTLLLGILSSILLYNAFSSDVPILINSKLSFIEKTLGYYYSKNSIESSIGKELLGDDNQSIFQKDGEWIGDFTGSNLTYGHFFQHLYLRNPSKRHDGNSWNFGHCPVRSEGIDQSSSLIQTSSFSSLNVIDGSTIVIDYMLYPSGHLGDHHSVYHKEWRFGKLRFHNITSLSSMKATSKYKSTALSQVQDNGFGETILDYIFIGSFDFFVSNSSEKEGNPTVEYYKLFSLEQICFYFNQFQWNNNFVIKDFPISTADLVLSMQLNPNKTCSDILRRKAFCNETSQVFVFESPGTWTGFLLLLVVLGGITMVFSVIGGSALLLLAVFWLCYRGMRKMDGSKVDESKSERTEDTSGDDFVARRRLLHGDLDIDDEDQNHAISPSMDIDPHEASEAPVRRNSRITMVNPSPVVTTAEAAHLLGITGRKHFRFFQ